MKCWFVAVVLVVGCDGSIDGGPVSPDAAGTSGAPDAAVGGGGPDASPTAPDAGPSPNEPGALRGITELHNQVRAMVGVGPMTWDPALAAVAQSWADLCTDVESPIGLVDHNAGRSDNYPGYVGENIYGAGGGATADGTVSLWAAEKTNYDYANNRCAAGKVCGHYTQIVWRDSIKLGCGISNCAGLQFGNTIVCNYSPGGNFNGQIPY